MAGATSQPAPLTLTDPKVTAAALASGGKLLRTDVDQETGRLTFLLTGCPLDFVTRILNDEVTVSARAFISAMESVLGMIAAHQRRRR